MKTSFKSNPNVARRFFPRDVFTRFWPKILYDR
jgi:hypothetical protein